MQSWKNKTREKIRLQKYKEAQYRNPKAEKYKNLSEKLIKEFHLQSLTTIKIIYEFEIN